MEAPVKKFCTRCGANGPFSSERALKCVKCQDATVEERQSYHRHYHKARGRALSDLIEAHYTEFQHRLAIRRAELESEDGNGDGSRPSDGSSSSDGSVSVGPVDEADLQSAEKAS